MRFINDAGLGMPIYRQIANSIIDEIEAGTRLPGERLPTVRKLAEDAGLSQGTAKHVYDILESEGYIIKEQGRGTFVREADVRPTGDKARAMDAINRLLDEMHAMSFSWKEIRIFLDLKLRERENDEKTVRIAAVDCSPEALNMMREQVLSIPNVEVNGYLLDNVIDSPRQFDPQSDIVVTTTTHSRDLGQKMWTGREPVCLVMALGAETAVELAAIKPETRVGIVCKSQRFAKIILNACNKYCKLRNPIQIAFFGDTDEVKRVTQKSELLILVPNYHLFASQQEKEYIQDSIDKPHILYKYQVEKGSIVYLENQVRTFLKKSAE